MKKMIAIVSATFLLMTSCQTNRNLNAIQPKSGVAEIPAKGELRLWQNTKHGRFTVTLTNNSPNQSCEVYRVTSNGNEKWVNPSLLANTSMTVSVPADGHLFFKNFNNNTFTVNYTVNE
jgi:hypothetical protein